MIGLCSEPLDSSHARSDNEETLAGVAVKSFIVNTGESGNTYLLLFIDIQAPISSF